MILWVGIFAIALIRIAYLLLIFDIQKQVKIIDSIERKSTQNASNSCFRWRSQDFAKEKAKLFWNIAHGVWAVEVLLIFYSF